MLAMYSSSSSSAAQRAQVFRCSAIPDVVSEELGHPGLKFFAGHGAPGRENSSRRSAWLRI